MPPALLFAATHGPDLAAWLFAHAADIGDGFARIARPVAAAVTDPAASVDRIGPALVSLRDGQTEVLGLLHQHTTTLDGITAAVDGVGAGQQALGRSVDLLGTLSMVGLGAAALSQVHLAFQFAALTRRLDRLAAEVRQVKTMMHAEYRAALNAGLIKLKNGLDLADGGRDGAGHQF